MNHQSEKPGYGMQLAKGATSLAEAWDARRASSQNHFMLGQINEWFFHDLAGIQPDPAAPGFKNIVIKPAIVDDLNRVRASYESVRGQIVSEWTKEEQKLTLNITIPPNTTATIYVPAADPQSVTEGKSGASEAPGVEFLRSENGCTVYQVNSGQYVFGSNLQALTTE
jgi:alpha-L-rhamnosidase